MPSRPDQNTQPRNKFVETALAYALSYLAQHGIQESPSLAITILADSDYYSHESTSKPCSKFPQSRFKDFGVSLQEAHKTGLGSSAALVTSLVSAVVLHSLNLKANDDLKRKLHNLAQTAHCVAQGKVGSGFDVAAAVYGTCIYRRFSPTILDNLGTLGSTDFGEQLARTVDDVDRQIWDTQIDESSIGLPKGLRLVMCDVDCGSETPSMVKKVMAWRTASPKESLALWEALSKANMELAAVLQSSSNTDRTTLKDNILKIRSLIREMSAKAGVPIEPPVQTHLLDGCSTIQGVVGGVVPGAGGYDALAIILEDQEEVLLQLQEFLKSYQSPPNLSHDTQIGKVRLLDVKQEVEGVKIESLDQYAGWT